MPKYVTEAVVVHCIDFRFQEYLDKWLVENLGHGNYDRVAYAGGVLDFETIFKQIEISERLHEIKKVVLVNHEDCGAYGAEGNKKLHTEDLRAAREKVGANYKNLAIELYYLHLDGTFEKVNEIA